jgi:HK97 family phage portal protein
VAHPSVTRGPHAPGRQLQHVLRFSSPLAQRASPDDPTVSLSDVDLDNDTEASLLFGGGAGDKSEPGIKVTRKLALGFAPYWRALTIISEAVARCPLLVYKKAGKGKEEDARHPAYRLLRRKPNEYMTANVFQATLTMHACHKGNGYAYILRNGRGDPVELLPLDPDETYPVRADGQLWYVTRVMGDRRKLPASDVFHLKGPSWDGLVGLGWGNVGKETLAQGIAARKFTAGYYRRGATPSVVIEVDGRMKPSIRRQLRTDWERMQTGLDNAHRTAILQNGAKAKSIGTSAKDAQATEAQQLSARMVSALTGIPPHKLGDNSRMAYNSLEQENQSCLEDGFEPWLSRWEEEGFEKLLTEKQKSGETHAICFDRTILVQPSLATLSQFFTAAKAARLLTTNEIREWINYNPIEGGDKLDVTPNMQPSGASTPAGEPTPKPTEEPDNAKPPEET